MSKINTWTTIKGRPQKTPDVSFLQSIGHSPDKLHIRDRNGKTVSGPFSAVRFTEKESAPFFDWGFLFQD